MNAVHRNLHIVVSFTLSMLLLLTGCSAPLGTPSADQEFIAESAQTSVPCEACDQATLAAVSTQQENSVDNQAVSNAEIVRANAQATLDAANATVGAIQTQDQNNANVIAAQIASTAEIERANAQATLNSASATQSIALTQDAIRQTQMADLATSNAQALMLQQNNNALAAGTQTAVANNIATQTQAAAATSQWYADQDRQRAEQRQGPIAFLWTLCLPTFLVIFAGLVLWGFWRWLRIQQANQRILENPVDKLPAPAEEVKHHRHDDLVQYLESDIDSGYQVTTPDDQVQKWVDEVKNKLNDSDKKNENDNTDK
jgi:hypothetical protein